MRKKASRACTRNRIKYFVSCKRSTRALSSYFKRNNLLNSKRSTRALSSYFKRNNLLNSKRSQGQIIVTILLILLTITLITIIGNLVIPMIKDKLEETKCFDALGLLEIDDEYTCYESVKVQVSIKRIQKDVEIDGFLLAIDGETFKITGDNDLPEGVELKTSSNGKIPKPGGQKIYLVSSSSKPTDIKVAPILNSQTCDVSDEIDEIGDCP